MKAKELIDILNKMDPETELSLYCGGEDYYEDHPLEGVEYASDDGEIVFNLGNAGKYGIAKEVDMEDFTNSLDCVEFDWKQLDWNELNELLKDFHNCLANDDCYDACYNQDLCELLKERYPNLCGD